MTKTSTILKLLRLQLTVILLFAGQQAFAQKEIVVKGRIFDSLEKTALDSAMVFLKTQETDLSVYTDASGSFFFKGDFIGDSLVLRIHHKNFTAAVRKLSIKSGLADAGNIFLTPVSKMMEDIVITARTPAIVVKKDTTEYTIDSFEKKNGAMIGDVLKDLPGFEIDEEGRILHNGKPVSRILVNGEEFFGGDRNLSLNNLPADLVSKLQVMDTRTKEQVFAGLESDGEDKTINIKLKTGVQAFGTASASAGTQGQQNASLMGNFLKDRRHLSVIGSTGRNRKLGFNKANDALNQTMQNAGVHYRDKLAKKISINGSATMMGNGSEQETVRQNQQYFKADSFFITDSYVYNRNKGKNQQANLTLELENKKLLGTLTIMYAGGNNRSGMNYSSGMMENGFLKNKSQRNTAAEGNNTNVSSNLSLNRRFDKKGRTLSFNVRANYWKNINDNLNHSNNLFYDDGIFTSEDILRQRIIARGSSQNLVIGVNFIEPITKDLRLQLSQNFEFNNAENERNTLNVDSFTHEEVLDGTYSDQWLSKYGKSNTSALLIYELKDLYLTAGVTVQKNEIERVIENHDVIRQKQDNISPTVVANYKISKTKTLRFNFSSNWQNPNMEQLQPVPDNSNPMYIRMGNPALKPAFQQNYNLSYTGLYEKSKTLSFSLGYVPTLNSIVNAIYYDPQRRRVSQFVNVDGVFALRSNWNFTQVLNGPSREGASWGFNGSGGYGRNVFFDKTTMVYTRNFNIRQNINYSRLMMKGRERSRITASMALTYNRMFAPPESSGINSRSLGLSPKLGWNYKLRDFMDVTSTYTVYHSRLDYSNSSNKSFHYTDHVVNNSFQMELGQRLVVETSLGYRYNGRLSRGAPNQEQWLWNALASVRLFKNQAGLLSLSAFDLLNNSAELTRTISDSWIEDVQTPRQRGYFILSFHYNWTKRK